MDDVISKTTTNFEVTFDVNQGFDQLVDLAKDALHDIPKSAVQLDVQIANVHSSEDFLLSNTSYNEKATAEIDPAARIDAGQADVMSYYLANDDAGFAMRHVLVYATPSNGFSFALGWYLLKDNPDGSWVTCVFDKDLDCTNLSDGDLGELVGTNPNDIQGWPKFGEIIPGISAGRFKPPSTFGSAIHWSDGYLGVAAEINWPNNNQATIKALIFGGWDIPEIHGWTADQ